MADMVSLKDKRAIEDAVADALVETYGSLQQRTARIKSLRDACDRRGYHRVSSAPKGRDFVVCYDCELWIDEYIDVPYKIVPL